MKNMNILKIDRTYMKSKIIIITLSFFLLICGWFLWNHGAQPQEDASPPEVINPYADAEIKAVVIPSEKNTFGYDIYVYGSVLVHQPSRPGLPGRAGFASEEDAMKVAELVIKKIRNNEMPPTVAVEEVRELGVLNNEQ